MDILGSLIAYLSVYRYSALFFITLAGAIGVPIPTNTMLLAVGAFAGDGQFSLLLSFVLAAGANIVGDIFDYMIARTFGERVIRALRLERSHIFLPLREELRADASGVVFSTRFAGMLSPFTSILAGAFGVKFSTFILYDILGDALEAAGLLALGYAVGDYWVNFPGILSGLAGAVAFGAALVIGMRTYRRMIRKYGG